MTQNDRKAIEQLARKIIRNVDVTPGYIEEHTINGVTKLNAMTNPEEYIYDEVEYSVPSLVAFYSNVVANFNEGKWTLYTVVVNKLGGMGQVQEKQTLCSFIPAVNKLLNSILTRKEPLPPIGDYVPNLEYINAVASNLFALARWYNRWYYFNNKSSKIMTRETNEKKLDSNRESIIKYIVDEYKQSLTNQNKMVPETNSQTEILNKLKDKGYLIDRYNEETNTHSLVTPDGTPVDTSVIKSIAKDVAKADIYRQAANRKGIDFRQSRATADNLMSGDFGLTGRDIDNTHNNVVVNSLKPVLERRKPIKIKHDLHFNPELLKRNYH